MAVCCKGIMKSLIVKLLFFLFSAFFFFACAPDREFSDDNGENIPPVVAASVPDYYLINEQLIIDAGNSRDSDGAIVKITAIFGDGTPEETSTDGFFYHTFESLGRFTINITVYDDMGESGERNYEILILDVKPPDCKTQTPNCLPGRECKEDGYCYTTD